MLNAFIIRKIGALLLTALLSTICFFVGLLYYGMIGGIGFLAGGLLISILIANFMLSNPFSSILEGSGILALDMTSAGIITPFIVNVQPPYIKGRLRGKAINDVFDRNAVFNLAEPVVDKRNTATPITEGENAGGLKIELNREAYNKSRFGLYQFPTLIYNGYINSFVTKEFFSEQEKDTFAEHGVLYLNTLMQDLTSQIRDFGRYIVETLKPKASMFGNKWIWIILVIVIIVIIALFAPQIITTLKGTMGGTLGSAAPNVSPPPS